jgi:TnpA family transposase
MPETGGVAAYPNLACTLARPIDWALVEQQYDEFVRYTTAVVERTADPEAILRRFTRSNVQHPTYKALAELGKAVKTIFLCRYLSDEALRREIHEGLNVVETWNSANGFIFFSKGGVVASNRLDDQEVSVHALHLLQSCLVYVNTLMLQRVLADGSSTWSIWSINSSRRKRPVVAEGWLRRCCATTSSSSTNSATCRSANPAASCCSI